MSNIPFLKKVENKKYTFFDPLLQKKVTNTFAIRQYTLLIFFLQHKFRKKE
jgi:hypothetical protein